MGRQSRFYLIWRIEKESVCCYFSRLVINHKYTRGLNCFLHASPRLRILATHTKNVCISRMWERASLGKAGADSPDIVWCSCAVGPNNTKQAQCLPLTQLQESYLDVTVRRIWPVLSKNQQHPITLDSPLTSCLLLFFKCPVKWMITLSTKKKNFFF